MDTPPLTPPSSLATTALRKRRLRRALITSSIVVLVLLGAAFMLPIWASTEQGRQYALQQMNRNLNGTLTVRAWSLGWFSGIRMEDVVLATKDGTHVFECSAMQTDLTLWGWLWGNYDVGNTVLTAPRLTVRHYRDGTNDLQRLLTPPASPLSPPSPSIPSPPPSVAGVDPPASALEKMLDSLRGSFRIEKGEITLSAEDATVPIRLSAVTAEIPIASSATPIHVTLDARSLAGAAAGGDASDVHLVGDLPAVERWARDPLALLWHLNGTAGSVPVGALAAWLNQDAKWEEFFGPTVQRLNLDSRVRPGASPGVGTRMALFSVLLQNAANELMLSFSLEDAGTAGLPGTAGRGRAGQRVLFQAVGSGTGPITGPVPGLLEYVNPILAGAGGDAATLKWTAHVERDLDDAATLRAATTLAMSHVLMRPSPMLSAITTLARAGHVDVGAGSPSALAAAIPTLRVDITDGRVQASALVLTLENLPAMTFTGSAGLDRSVDLLLAMPLVATGAHAALAAATLRVPIRGTIDAPVLDAQAMRQATGDPP